jgi:hypothetical protein
MPDTFGLCGVLAMTANGLLANKNNWKDVDYDPGLLKTMFDKWWKTREGDSAWMWFDKKYGNKLKGGPNDFAILTSGQIQNIGPVLEHAKINRKVFPSSRWREALSEQDSNRLKTDPKEKPLIIVETNNLVDLYDQFGVNEGMGIAALCEYPIQKGTHTHWLAARKQPNSDKLLVVGDLKPFGIPAVGIEVPYEDALQAMNRVVGASPTTNLTTVLAEKELSLEGRNLHDDKMFKVNFVRRLF